MSIQNAPKKSLTLLLSLLLVALLLLSFTTRKRASEPINNARKHGQYYYGKGVKFDAKRKTYTAVWGDNPGVVCIQQFTGVLDAGTLKDPIEVGKCNDGQKITKFTWI